MTLTQKQIDDHRKQRTKLLEQKEKQRIKEIEKKQKERIEREAGIVKKTFEEKLQERGHSPEQIAEMQKDAKERADKARVFLLRKNNILRRLKDERNVKDFKEVMAIKEHKSIDKWLNKNEDFKKTAESKNLYKYRKHAKRIKNVETENEVAE